MTLPHTITTWYLYAHTISSASSVCTVESLPVKVYNSMYVRVKIPNAIHVQDQVQLHVIIYNFERESLPVSIYMLTMLVVVWPWYWPEGSHNGPRPGLTRPLWDLLGHYGFY